MASFRQIMLMLLNYFVSQNYKLVKHPDSGLTINQYLGKYGYPLETHRITTEDGYILTAHRIPHGRGTNTTNKHPVILTIGPCSSGEMLLLPGHPNGIAWYLADRDFDVWLVNNRGNVHSRKHKTLDPDKDPKYWDFSWHEMGVYDLPAAIDYVLKVTSKEKIFYLGYSQGATIYFVLTSERPEYNKKIALGVNVATPAMLGHNRLLIFRIMSKHRILIKNIADALGVYELLPNKVNNFFRRIMLMLCSEMTVFIHLCSAFLHFPVDSKRVDPMVLQLVFQYAPAKCSTKQFYHFEQLINTDVFGPYDYGPNENLQLYEQTKPPQYKIENITTPTAFFYSTSDLFTYPEGIERLVSRTKNHEIHRIDEDFSHVDFLISKDVQHYVNKPIYNLFQKYTPAAN